MKGHSSAVRTTTTQSQGLGADNTALLKSICPFFDPVLKKWFAIGLAGCGDRLWQCWQSLLTTWRCRACEGGETSPNVPPLIVAVAAISSTTDSSTLAWMDEDQFIWSPLGLMVPYPNTSMPASVCQPHSYRGGGHNYLPSAKKIHHWMTPKWFAWAKHPIVKPLAASCMLQSPLVPTLPSWSHSALSQFLENPREAHWEAIKWFLHYHAGTKTHTLTHKWAPYNILRFMDADGTSQGHCHAWSTPKI